MKNNRTSRGICIPDFKFYYSTIVLKPASYWYKNRHINEWNWIKDPDENPQPVDNLIFLYWSQKYIMEKENNFNKYCCSNWMSECRRMEIDPYLSPCTKGKSKCIRDLNIKPDSLNVREDKEGNMMEHWQRSQWSNQNTECKGTKINNC